MRSLLLFALLAIVCAVPQGIVQLDSFTGATDDDKLTAAFTYVKAQTFIPAIQFPDREVVFSKSRSPFSGMKLIGPGAYGGPKNLELSSGKFSNGRVRLNVGFNTTSWMVGNATYYDVFIGNLAFYGGSSNAQFWHQPVASGQGLYACQFDALTFYGFKHVFGQPTNKAAMTQVFFTGHWQVIGPSDTQFSIGGSDNSFWMAGYLNIGGNPNVAGANRYLMQFDWIGKTDVGKIYVTAMNGWKGIRVTGGGTFGKLNFYGGEFEGQNDGDPCHGTVIRVEGGGVVFYGLWAAYAMRTPDAASHGVIEVTGGNVVFDRPTYLRGSTPSTTPFVYVSGGYVEVRSVHGVSGVPVVYKAAGTVVTDATVSLLPTTVAKAARSDATDSTSGSNFHAWYVVVPVVIVAVLVAVVIALTVLLLRSRQSSKGNSAELRISLNPNA